MIVAKKCFKYFFLIFRKFLSALGFTCDFYDPYLLRGLTIGRRIPAEDLSLFLESFRPIDVGVSLIRIGGPNDGGYLLPKDFDGISACLSAGSDALWNFEKDLYRVARIPSHIIDSQDKKPIDLASEHTYTSKWLGSVTKGELITLQDWIQTLPIENTDLILQMDIEGYEWETLLNVPNSVLSRFRIIIVEFHRIPNLLNKKIVNRYYEPLLKKLDQNFGVVHLHANNSCGETSFGGICFPNVFEVTYLRRDRFTESHSFAKLPNDLDQRNDPTKPDIFFNWRKSS